MKIRSITIGGFKNLQKSKIELQSIVAIVSPNNYGKSNLLEAINFGIDFISASERDRKTMMRWIKGIPINKALANDDFFFEIEFLNDMDDEYRFAKYGFSFSWFRDDGSGQRITDEWIEARPNESVKYTSYLKRNEGKYRKEKDTNSFRKIKLNDSQLSIDALVIMDELPINPLIQAIKKIDYRVCSSLDLRDRFQPIPIDYVQDDELEAIAFDDNDVPRAIYKLGQLDPEKYDLFLDAIYTLFPEFSEISVKPYTIRTDDPPKISMVVSTEKGAKETEDDLANVPFKLKDEIYRIFITSKYLNQPIDITRMSTGTKRIFWLLVNVFIAASKKMSFIGVEELETSIHPKMLKNLLEFLDEVLNDSSLIITSHSPFLVQYIKPERIIVGCPNDNGTAQFKKIKSNKIKQMVNLSRDHGMALGEYIFELLSGDSDSRKILSFFLEG